MKKIFVLTITAIMVAVSVSFVNYLTKEYQRAQLATQLDMLVESYKKGDVKTISISTITPFEWEKMYLFAPYTSRQHIVEVTNLLDATKIKTAIESDDSIVLFVFVNENKIIQYMDFHRETDFAYSIQEFPYNPSSAIFVLDEKGQPTPISQ